MSSDENKKYHLISVEPSSAEVSTDDAFVQNGEQGFTSSLSEAPAVERESISVEKAVSSGENERAQQVKQAQSAYAQQAQRVQSAYAQQAQQVQPAHAQQAQQVPSASHAQQAQQDLQDLVQKELDEQIGSDPNVPLANMRVFIIVALLLIIAGFIIYFVFLK